MGSQARIFEEHNQADGGDTNCAEISSSRTSCRLCHVDPFINMLWLCCCCLPTPMALASGGVLCSRLWSTSQQCGHPGGVCPQIQGRQCGAYVGAVEEMMCVVCVDVTGA